MTVVWRPVVGFEGSYEVSSSGDVRSVDRKIFNPARGGWHSLHGKMLAKHPRRGGYTGALLYRSGRQFNMSVHRLVLEAFVGPGHGLEACHNNGDPKDNRVENLRWGTSSENVLDQVTHGTHHMARKTHCKQGHPFNEENTLRTKRGRQCRRCNRERQRAYRLEVTG